MNSTKPLRVGRLPFLVCAPFFHSTLKGLEGFEFQDGVPRFLNAELQAGRIDCAPSSSFEYGLNFESYQLMPGISTSSRMEMKSVLLLSQLPWEDLNGQPVTLSPDSATSNVLFQILCEQRFHVLPKFASANDCVAQVYIGDRALQESISGHWKFRYDLADVWAKWQGLPFSFGLWIVRREALAQKPDLVRAFHAQLLQSLAEFRSDPGKALDVWTAVYPSILPRPLMLQFYETADYSFSQDHVYSLDLFYQLAYEGGFLKSLPKLDFIEM